LSDRAMKANVRPADPQHVLDRVAAMSIGTWNYRTQDSAIRHMGPTAQDFHAAFGLGENDTSISVVDAQGVALAAIQGLNAKVDAQAAVLAERDARIEEQSREIAAQRAEIAELRRSVEVLLSRTSQEGKTARAD
jgi:hypothetical protein